MENQIISINLVPNMSTPAVVRVSQYDVGRPLVFKVYDGTVPADLTGVTATVAGTKRSGLGFSESGTVSGNTVTLDTTLAMTQEDGSIPAEIRFSKTGEDVGTANFILAVEKSPHLEGTTDGTTETMADLETRLQGQIDSMTLGIDEDDGLLYLYVNGVKQGEGVDVGGGATRYTITYNLATGIVSSNIATKISEGSAYASVISSSDSDYQVDDITVTMGGVNITSTAVSENEISISSVTGDIAITVTALYYPSVETDASALTITSGGTGTLRVKLHAQPTQSQTVTLHSDALTLSTSSLTFTTSNWNTYQSVTVTAPSVETTEYAYINLTNSDPLMTESTVMVTVKELGYEDLVNTTIPTTGQHTLTAADFTSTADTTIDGQTYIRLYGYNGAYTNVVMPTEMDGKKTLTCASSSPSASICTFATNTTIEYVTFEDGCKIGEAGAPSSNKASGIFKDCTQLIGVSNMPTTVVGLANAFSGCTSLKFVDNLDELVNVTDMSQTFYGCTGLEYVQDLSGITGCGLYRTFRGCTSLKKIFGLPQPASSATFEYAFMQTQVERVTIPANASSLIYCFLNNTHVNHVEILADGLTTTNLNQVFGSPSQNIDVYANPNSTTLASLQSMFASSTKVTVHEIGSGGTLPSIVVWGDSTSSPNRPWIEWPARLQTKLGTSEYLVKNQAVSGEWTTSTSARQGGNAMHTNAFEIPADTSAALVTLTTADDQTFSNAPIFNAGGAFNPCAISNVEGSISKSGASYYFTRTEAGNAVSVADDTIVTSNNDTVFNAAGNVMLVNIGHNSGWDGDAATLVNQMQLMVNHFLALGGTDYIISGPWSGTWISTDSGWAVTEQVASLASTAFGSHWLDLPADMAANCQTDNPNVSWTAEDLAYIAAGKTPLPSLTYDNTHPTEAGANSQMMAFYRKGVALGYWT